MLNVSVKRREYFIGNLLDEVKKSHPKSNKISIATISKLYFNSFENFMIQK